MKPSIDLLAPRPSQASLTGERLAIDGPVILEAQGEDAMVAPARRLVLETLERFGLSRTSAAPEAARHPWRLRLRPLGAAALGPDAYRLIVGSKGIDVDAASASGLFYGVATLAQWLRINQFQQPGRIQTLVGLSVEDAPGFRHRGVMLDISRNRVPTMESLYALVDRLAAWKLNQLQLYTEHTFAYRKHEIVWRNASPMTAEEIRALDRYCRDRLIELVPNQQSFGHMHRWLVHQPYRALAECPDGVEHPFSSAREPFSLCPTDPRALELLHELYDELLPNFTSRQFNVGLDETFDLGTGRSKSACDARGRHQVYLDFVGTVRDLAAAHGRRLQLWADIVLAHPELVARLPSDVVALAWGYEADHPFAEEAAALADAGVDFYVCPGTSSWNSFGGRGANALENLASGARAGSERRASGYLIADWGDNGHLQPPVVSSLGLLAGASMAWNPADADHAETRRWARLLDLHAFDGSEEGLGTAVTDLADAYLQLGARPKNGTALFHLLMSPDDALDHPRYRGLEARGLAEVSTLAEATRRRLSNRPMSDGTDLEASELDWVAEALDLAARVGEARLAAGRSVPIGGLPEAHKAPLRQRLEALLERLPDLWLASSRPGGLEDSRARLGRLLTLLRAE